MPKFNVTIEFGVSTEVEPDGVRFDLRYNDHDGIEEYEDSSYFSRQDVSCDGGSVSFQVTAEDEDAAEEIAHTVVYDGMEVDDDNGFAWLVGDVNYDIEEVEIPMDLDRATTLVEAYLASMEGMDDDLKEAFGFLMDAVVDQARRNVELASTITELRSENTRLGRLLTELQVAQAGSEAPEVGDSAS